MLLGGATRLVMVAGIRSGATTLLGHDRARQDRVCCQIPPAESRGCHILFNHRRRLQLHSGASHLAHWILEANAVFGGSIISVADRCLLFRWGNLWVSQKSQDLLSWKTFTRSLDSLTITSRWRWLGCIFLASELAEHKLAGLLDLILQA